ncbi:MAG: aromatic acid exporter family protein [Brachybacterium sp.]|uniref:FUSC family protein n=1 Tax=Brachybacterium sp. TaxID=1891286 RepID=UPI003241C79C
MIAATAAWWLSLEVLDSMLPFLAPWTALLTVQATVHRSLSRGAQTTVASAIGVGLSFMIGAYLGVSVWTFALALLIGLAGARLSWIRDEGVAIATTAIFVLGSGFSQQQPLLLDRILEVGVGVGVGVLVNLLIIPPLRDQQASRYVDSLNRRMGGILINMADEFTSSWETDKAEHSLAVGALRPREQEGQPAVPSDPSQGTVARWVCAGSRGELRGDTPTRRRGDLAPSPPGPDPA